MDNISFKAIPIPDDLDSIIENSVTKAVKYRRIKRLRISSIGIVVCLIITGTIGAFNPVLAAKVPRLRNVFKIFEKNAYFPGNYSEYAEAVNEKVTSNGVSVTLSDVVCDGQSLYVSYLIESKEPFEGVSFNTSSNEAQPGTTLQLTTGNAYSRVSFSNQKLPIIQRSVLEGYFINDNTFAGMEKYELSEINTNIPDEFTFELKLNYISKAPMLVMLERGADLVKGNWSFKVPVIVNKSLAKTIVPLNAEKDGYRIDSIVITPFEMKVRTTNPQGAAFEDCLVKVYRADDNHQIEYKGGTFGETTRVHTFEVPPEDCDRLRIEMYSLKDLPNPTDKHPLIPTETTKVVILNKEVDIK